MSDEGRRSDDAEAFTPCPRCGEFVSVVTSIGPTEHIARPCGCRVSGSLLE